MVFQTYLHLSNKMSIIPYMGIRFLAITQPFFVHSDWNFYDNSGDFYLSIGAWWWEIMILILFWKKSYFWRENGRGCQGGTKGSGTSRPDQKVGLMDGPFGSTVISKHVFKSFGSEPLLRKARVNFRSVIPIFSAFAVGKRSKS